MKINIGHIPDICCSIKCSNVYEQHLALKTFKHVKNANPLSYHHSSTTFILLASFYMELIILQIIMDHEE